MTEDIPIYQAKCKEILVLSGCGIKGIAHIGALQALEHLKYLDKFEIFAGTSSGAMVCSLYLIGYSPGELYDFIKTFDFNKLKNINISNITSYGLDDGTKFTYILQRLVQGKGHSINITLKELYNKTKKKLILATSCLDTGDAVYLSHESHPDLPVVLAIRLSTAVPFYFTPIIFENRHYVDGGCFDNYPVHLFQSKPKDIMGILISNSKSECVIDNFETYILKTFQCIMEGLNYNAKRGYEDCTIEIYVEPIMLVDYNITDSKKDDLFLEGYNGIINKLFG